MKLQVSSDKKFLVLIDSTQLELEQLQSSLTRKIDNYFIMRKKFPHWDGEVSFIDQWLRIPIGLWKEIQKICKQYIFNLEIVGVEHLFDKEFDETDFIEWSHDYFENPDFQPRDYQNEATVRLLKYRNCTEEISTSGGKTLIVFMLFKYLYNKKDIKKMLYIVPNINLVTQTEEKFYEYEELNEHKSNWKSECVFSGVKVNDTKPNIVFGTFQSLVKKPLEYFEDFDVVCADETHHAKNASIKNILIKCYKAKYKFGVTGSLPPEGSLDSFTIQSYLGPCVYTIKSSDLIAAGNATPVNVIQIELDYLNDDIKKKLYNLRNVSADEKDGVKLLNLEKDILRSDRKRLLYVCNTIAQTTKNSLVLFADIKNDYGRIVFDWLKENTDKIVYYIDGGTKNDNREYYKKQIEIQENTIIVASVGTFSEGVDILNVHNMFILESHKSEIIIRQILGRGMRLMEGKEKMIVIDFCDNYEYGTHKYQKKNYLLRHANTRAQIYKDRGFPYKRFKIKL